MCIRDRTNPGGTYGGGLLTNNGSLTIGTGTWLLRSSFAQSSAGASLTFAGTTIDVLDGSNAAAPTHGDFAITAGTFTADNLTTFYIQGDLDNSADLLPTGLDLILDGGGSYDDTILTCSGNESFNSVEISKTNI